MQKIEIKIKNNLKLVAEVNPDPAGYKEIFVGLEENGCWIQDLAIVGQRYHYDDGDVINEDNAFRVLVYSDNNREDYTHEFKIDKHEFEEE